MVIMKLIFVTGLAGIDRKTIVDLAMQRAGKKREFRVVDFDRIGNVAEDVRNSPDLATARQVLSKFHSDMEKAIISDLKEQKGDVIVIGYLTFETGHGYMKAIPDNLLQSLKPDNIVILETSEGIDPKKDEHQRINRYYGTMYSSVCDSLLKIIKFREKRMMEAVSELGDLLKQ